MSHSQVSEPQKLCERIHVYCCFKPLSLEVIYYAATDNKSFNFSVPQFIHLLNWDNTACPSFLHRTHMVMEDLQVCHPYIKS